MVKNRIFKLTYGALLLGIMGCSNLNFFSNKSNEVLVDSGILDERRYFYYEKNDDSLGYSRLEIYSLDGKSLEEIFVDGRDPLEADGKVDFYLKAEEGKEVIYTPSAVIQDGRKMNGLGMISREATGLSSNKLSSVSYKFNKMLELIKEKKRKELQ